MRIVKSIAILLLLIKASGCGGGATDAAVPVALNLPAAATSNDAALYDAPLSDAPSEDNESVSVMDDTPQPKAAAPEPTTSVSPNPPLKKPAAPLPREAREMELISAIRQRPWDERPILDFADWLETRDKPRADLIRKQVQLAKLEYNDPARRELQGEIDELLKAHRARWTAPLGELAERATIEIEFGLIDHIVLHEATYDQIALLKNVPELRSLELMHPKLTGTGYAAIAALPNIDYVEVVAKRGGENLLLAFDKLPPRTWLYLFIDDLDRERFNAMNERRMAQFQSLPQEEKLLVAARWLVNARDYQNKLDGPPKYAPLGQSSIRDAEMPLLAALPELERISLFECNITSAGAAHLGDLKKLTYLDLTGTKVDSIASLAELRNLKELLLSSRYQSHFGDAGLRGLENFTLLEDLYLSDDDASDATVRRLAPLVELRSLDLSIGKLQNDDSLAALAGMKKLKSLTLRGVEMSDDALQHFTGLTDLETLSIRVESGSGAGFKHLAGLDKLRVLFLGGKGVTDEALAQLAPLAGLKTIVAQNGSVTKAGAERLAAQLPRVTIILDKDVVKSPRASYTFARKRFDDSVSLLLPTDWSGGGEPGFFIGAVEEGWKDVGHFGGEHAGAALIYGEFDFDSTSAEEAVMASVNSSVRATPVILQRNILTVAGSDDVASCIYKYRESNGTKLVCAFKTKDGMVVLKCDAPESRFAEFEPLFKFVARSVRIGDDPKLHAAETMEVPAEKLDP